MAPAAVAAVEASTEPPLSNGCATVDAMDRQTAAIDRQTSAIQLLFEEIKATREAFAPAADAISDLGAAQRKLCSWLVGNRLKIAASIPAVLVGIGAVSPNAAHLVGQLLQAWGLQ